MICQYCNQEHDGTYGSGKFCNSKCSHGFSTLKDKSQKKKVQCSNCLEIIEVGKRSHEPVYCKKCQKERSAKQLAKKKINISQFDLVLN
jgi:hypothetical protein